MTEPTDPLEGLIEPTEPEDHSPLEKPGNKIGPYRLLQVLGSGGMGEVWLAERREPYVQRVALKVVKPGMDTKAVLSRFEQERQVLAQMSHPNIAKVLDAGVNEQGRPYFVMEYVPGKPITEFADEQKLSIQARLEYFLQVCNAIAHAHQKGVIHRDIKPGNILVSRGEIGEVGTGSSITTGSSAKVIDFGVAKAMAGGMTQQTVYTQIGEGIGTWGYMSPEQIEGDTQTPSDVYSLGVLLYELMCGEKPYDISSMRNFSPKERADFIRGVEVVPPSKRLLNSISQQKSRSISSVGQVNELRELDWVCLKALSPDLKGRFLSVHTLAEDVQRFISGEQVEAAPVTFSSQIKRYWKRNAGVVLSLGIGMVLLAIGSILVANQAKHNHNQNILLQEQQQLINAGEASNRLAAESIEKQKRELKSLEELLRDESLFRFSYQSKQRVLDGDYREYASIDPRIDGVLIRNLYAGGARSFDFAESINILSESGDYIVASENPRDMPSLWRIGNEPERIAELPPRPGNFYRDIVFELDDRRIAILSVGSTLPTMTRLRVSILDPLSGLSFQQKFDFSLEIDTELMRYGQGQVIGSTFASVSAGGADFQPSGIWFDLGTLDDLSGVTEPEIHSWSFNAQDGYVEAVRRGQFRFIRFQGSIWLSVWGKERPTDESNNVVWMHDLKNESDRRKMQLPQYVGDVTRVSTGSSRQNFILSTQHDNDVSYAAFYEVEDPADLSQIDEFGFALHFISPNTLDENLENYASASLYSSQMDTSKGSVLIQHLGGSGSLLTQGNGDQLHVVPALRSPYLTSNYARFSGPTQDHVLMHTSSGFMSLPRWHDSEFRVWKDILSNNQVRTLRTWLTRDRHQSFQALQFVDSSQNTPRHISVALPHGSAIEGYFTFEGQQFVLVNNETSSSLEIYFWNGKSLQLKCEFQSLVDAKVLTSIDPDSLSLYLFEQSQGNVLSATIKRFDLADVVSGERPDPSTVWPIQCSNFSLNSDTQVLFNAFDIQGPTRRFVVSFHGHGADRDVGTRLASGILLANDVETELSDSGLNSINAGLDLSCQDIKFVPDTNVVLVSASSSYFDEYWIRPSLLDAYPQSNALVVATVRDDGTLGARQPLAYGEFDMLHFSHTNSSFDLVLWDDCFEPIGEKSDSGPIVYDGFQKREQPGLQKVVIPLFRTE